MSNNENDIVSLALVGLAGVMAVVAVKAMNSGNSIVSRLGGGGQTVFETGGNDGSNTSTSTEGITSVYDSPTHGDNTEVTAYEQDDGRTQLVFDDGTVHSSPLSDPNDALTTYENMEEYFEMPDISDGLFSDNPLDDPLYGGGN